MKRALLSMAFALVFVVPTHARADSTSDIGEKMVRIFERVATIVDANKNDCNAMGDKLNGVIDENAAFLAAAKARTDAMTEAERHEFQTRYGARMQALIQRMMPGMQKCATNEKVRSALQRVR